MHPCRGGLQRTPGRGSVVSAAHWKNRDSRQRYDSLLLRARGRYEALACVMLAGASSRLDAKKPALRPAFSCVLVGDSGIEPLTSTV